MAKKRGLGTPISALLAHGRSEALDESEALATDTPNLEAGEQLTQLAITKLKRGKYQPRREMDATALEELADSIRTQGIIQPLIVRPAGDQYEIIAGERRWQAAKLAGLATIPVIIRQIADTDAIAMALIENIQREDLNPIEEAIALNRLLDEFDMTHQQVAEAVGKSRTSVTNLLRLLALPEDIKNLLERKQLEMGHARALITLPAALQLEAAHAITSRKLSVRETEALVKQLQAPVALHEVGKKPAEIDPDIQHLQEKLATQLKMRVAIQCNPKGKGKLVIHYKSLAELNGLLAQIKS